MRSRLKSQLPPPSLSPGDTTGLSLVLKLSHCQAQSPLYPVSIANAGSTLTCSRNSYSEKRSSMPYRPHVLLNNIQSTCHHIGTANTTPLAFSQTQSANTHAHGPPPSTAQSCAPVYTSPQAHTVRAGPVSGQQQLTHRTHYYGPMVSTQIALEGSIRAAAHCRPPPSALALQQSSNTRKEHK